jgi:membrane protease YdiL (CAAX protease family)
MISILKEPKDGFNGLFTTPRGLLVLALVAVVLLIVGLVTFALNPENPIVLFLAVPAMVWVGGVTYLIMVPISHEVLFARWLRKKRQISLADG